MKPELAGAKFKKALQEEKPLQIVGAINANTEVKDFMEQLVKA
jgi:hypothetical protein